MDQIETTTAQPAASNSAATSSAATSSAASSNSTIRPAFLAILIPFICVIIGAIVGLGIYFFVRRRRLRHRNLRGPGDGEIVAIGPAMEEGLNELGEAPPPYGGNHAMKEFSTTAVEVEETPAQPPPAYIAAMAIPTTRDGYL